MILLPENEWVVKDAGDKGRGVFAIKNIKMGTVVADYLGTIWDMDNDNFPELGGNI